MEKVNLKLTNKVPLALLSVVLISFLSQPYDFGCMSPREVVCNIYGLVVCSLFFLLIDLFLAWRQSRAYISRPTLAMQNYSSHLGVFFLYSKYGSPNHSAIHFSSLSTNCV